MVVSENISPILVFTLAKQHGGAEVRVVNFASALHNKHDYAVGVIANSPLHKKLTEYHLNVVPFAYNRFDPRLLLALVRTIRRDGYKTIDMQAIQSTFWGLAAALLTRIPNVVVTVHSSYGRYKNSFKGWLYETMLRFAAHKMGGRMIAVSESVKEYLLDIGVKAERIALVHNSVRWDEQPIQNSDPSFRQSLGWGKDCFVVLVVGRLEAVKGYDYLLDALASAVQERPQIRCLFVGEGQERNKLEAQVRLLRLEKYVHFAGFQKEVKKYLAVGDIFCMSSLSEGLPYALLEACVYRLPFLVTKVGDLAKLLHDGKTAVIVPPADAKALTEGLVWLYDHPEERVRLGIAAYEYLSKELSLEQMIIKTLAAYHDETSS